MSAQQTLNFAVLGTGRIADTQLAPALSKVEGARLWSVLSRDRERGRAFAERHGAQAPEPAYVELGTLLADPRLHAVIIATPDKLHAEQALAAAGAGKHVLVEKPMATDIDDGAAMVRVCSEAGVQLGVAYHLRWHAGHRLVARAVRAGELGTLRHMISQWTWQAPDDSNWRASEEVGRWWGLAGVGTHCLDLIRWIMVPACGEVSSIDSLVSHDVWQGPHDETALVSLQFESGATAQFCSSVLFESPSRLEIYGSGGYAICESTLGAHGGGSVRTHAGKQAFQVTNPFVGEIDDFIASIHERRPPEVDGREGLRNIELLTAAASGLPRRTDSPGRPLPSQIE
ncbi:MAG: Gfo/Idh/MocA family protein [Acidobacteriota bacterium]